MATLARREGGTRFPDLFDWLDSPWGMFPFASSQTFRIEDYVEANRYVVRAELPGLDPEKDIEVTVESGALMIHAERQSEHKEGHRSEFRYGSLTRSVTLPEGADPEHITASYDKGILEVTVPLAKAKKSARKIAVTKSG
jgi:HSP20 family molecular chaperone IbpA